MTVNALGSKPAHVDTFLPEDGHGEGSPLGFAAVSASDGAASSDALGNLAMHEDVRRLTHPANQAATATSQSGAPLYSSKSAPAASAAPATSRPTREQAIERVVEEFAKAGNLDFLKEWIDPKSRLEVRFVLEPGRESYFDEKTRQMVLGADATPGEHAQAIVFAKRAEQYAAEDAKLRARMGHDAYDRSVSRGRPDPALHDKYEPKTRAEYVQRRIDVVARAAVDAVEFTKVARDKGAAVPVTALEKAYVAAYQPAFDAHIDMQISQIGDESKPYGRGPYNPGLARTYADEAARPAGKKAVAEAMATGKVLAAGANETYAALFGREWDTINAGQVRKAEETAKAAAADRARAEGLVAARSELFALIHRIDPNGPEAVRAIELISAFSLKYPGQKQLFVAEADAALVRLLGRYGYVSDERVGKLASARLDYALSNFHRMSPDERTTMTNVPGARTSVPISHRLTYDELKAADAMVTTRTLPDGKKHTGTGAEYRQASLNNVNNHALAQLKQIRSAGPMSLVGRLFAGEQGAAVGAMFDSMIDVGVAHKTQVQVRSGVPNPSDADYRTPIDNGIRRPAPAVSPTAEGRPATPVAPASARPPAIARADAASASTSQAAQRRPNRSDLALADTQAAPGGTLGTASGGATAEAARSRRAAAADAVSTLPSPHERLEFDTVVDGIRRHGWGWHVNNDRATHEAAWRANGNTTDAPLAFRRGNHIHVDYRALTPAQERALDRALNEAALRR